MGSWASLKSSSLLSLLPQPRVSVMAVEPWSFRKRGFASVDGSCPNRTDVESWGAQLVEIQQGQSRPSV